VAACSPTGQIEVKLFDAVLDVAPATIVCIYSFGSGEVAIGNDKPWVELGVTERRLGDLGLNDDFARFILGVRLVFNLCELAADRMIGLVLDVYVLDVGIYLCCGRPAMQPLVAWQPQRVFDIQVVAAAQHLVVTVAPIGS